MVAIPDKDLRCRRIIELIESGMGVTESCREVGISEKTYYRWRKVHAPLQSNDND
ncbi:MAG: helix-turn-helix domain-containing protein [Sphingomonadales bacterium]|nr:helix-turn-helix domain-containing protein [Sphingomonadales bacterium]MBD3772725.1 helix-turn-helix domain-containing protein [Paracoccaceae bacterium]